MKNDTKSLILNGNYKEAERLTKKLLDKELLDVIFDLSYNTENISFLDFTYYLSLKNKNANNFYNISHLLMMAFPFIEGSSETSFYYAKESIKYDISYKEYLLLFHIDPAHLLSDKEAFNLANEILLVDSGNQTAKETLKYIKEKNIDLTTKEIKKTLTFKELIINGNYNEAEKLSSLYSSEELNSFLMESFLADTKEFSFIFFTYFLLLKSETSELHYLLSRLLKNFTFLEGGISSSFFHVKEAVKLNKDSKNISYKVSLLDFYSHPSHLLSDKEAIELSNEILSVDSDNLIAKEVLLNIEKKK